MFSYYHSISHKIPSIVSNGQQVMKINRQLRKRVKSSSFLAQIFETEPEVITKNCKGKVLDSTISQFLYQPSSITPLYENGSINTGQYRSTTINKFATVAPRIKKNMIMNNINDYSKCDKLHLPYNHLRNYNNKISINSGTLHENRELYSEQTDLNSQKQVTCTESVPVTKEKPSDKTLPGSEKKPTIEQLEHVKKALIDSLPLIFRRGPDYSLYTPDVIFINNIRGVETKGIIPFAWHMMLLKAVGHFKYSHVVFEILQITVHTVDDTVKVRWRIRGISAFRIMITFWKIKLWNMKEVSNILEVWHDGISTFHVNGNGIIYKVVVDKLIPDESNELRNKETVIATKLV